MTLKYCLFLDDNDNRQTAALAMRQWYRLFQTKTAQDTIDCLSAETPREWELVSLDHDLGGETYVDSGREDCGMEVVRWIVVNKPKIKRVIVHSYNEPAAKEMVLKLKDAGYNAYHQPFSVAQ